MSETAHPRFGRILLWACGAVVFLLAAYYLAQWLEMPLYPDEVAFRIAKARFLVDGATEYGLFPQCPANETTIPLVFLPAAYLLSLFDMSFGWSLVRAIPLTVVLAALGVTILLVVGRAAAAATLLLAAGFIGVAGSGLILSRYEVVLLLHGIACLAGYALIQRLSPSPIVAAVYLVLATLAALLSFFVHLQGLILAPIALLLVFAIATRQRSRLVRALAVAAALWVAGGTVVKLSVPQVRCEDNTGVANYVAALTLPGLAAREGAAGVGRYLAGKLGLYTSAFLFKPTYDINYLPGLEVRLQEKPRFFAVLNTAIWSMVLVNFVLACGVTLYAGFRAAGLLLARARSLRDRWLSVATEPYAYLILVGAGHLTLFVYDVPTIFYRSFYIHFALLAVNAIVLSSVAGRARLALWPAGVAAVLVCALSAAVVREDFKPKFIAGWTGPLISLRTDWPTVRADVEALADQCQIAASDSRIIVDDLTFDALKHHRHLMPITYILLGYDPHAKDAKSPGEILRNLSATAVIARCGNLAMRETLSHLFTIRRYGSLCCIKF